MSFLRPISSARLRDEFRERTDVWMAAVVPNLPLNIFECAYAWERSERDDSFVCPIESYWVRGVLALFERECPKTGRMRKQCVLRLDDDSVYFVPLFCHPSFFTNGSAFELFCDLSREELWLDRILLLDGVPYTSVSLAEQSASLCDFVDRCIEHDKSIPTSCCPSMFLRDSESAVGNLSWVQQTGEYYDLSYTNYVRLEVFDTKADAFIYHVSGYV